MSLSSQIRRKVLQTTKNLSSTDVTTVNRNPRNLELLQFSYKPSGYHLEKPGRCFWNKLQLNVSGRYVKAAIQHYKSDVVVKADTSEWAIRKQLFRTTDRTAFVNLARVFAHRCHAAGISEMYCDVQGAEGSKVEAFLKTLEENGIVLSEPERIKPDGL
ncbi:mRpL18 family protein [Megaselia abdita]